MNYQGIKILAKIKYEWLLDICYGCERLGHTTQSCKENVQMSENKPGHPLYDPWLIDKRPKKNTLKGVNGRIEKRTNTTEESPRRIWFDMMNEVRDPPKKNK